MDISERYLQLKGKARITLYDGEGNIKAYREQENLITDAGYDIITKNIGGPQATSCYVCAIGSDATSAAASDTTLGTELARVSGVFAHTDGTKIWTNTATFGAAVGTGNVYEAGLINDETSGGTLLNRQTFGLISKGASDVLLVVYTITLS